MLSVSGNHWDEIKINKRIIEKVKSVHNFSDIISKIIISRNFDNEEIHSINENINIYNPFLRNKDFKEGHKIIKDVLKKNEKILIIGDYDVDGCVSTALLVNYFKLLKKRVDYYIPDRLNDGYGANLGLIKKLTKKKPNLIIMVDCGSNSFDTVNFLKKKKIKSIIIDHHEIYKPYPKTDCLINPKKDCDYNEFNYFCSSTLVYFFILSFLDNINLKNLFNKNLIYVMLASICDVMPLRKVNRILALNVIKDIEKQDNYLFKKILEFKKKNRPLEINDFAFLIGPIINSAGRIGNANKIVQLLTSNNNLIKNKIINEIIKTNEKRKKIEKYCFKEINLTKFKNSKDDIIFLSSNIINEGISGIIAARLKEYFNRPSIVLTQSGNYYKASARSTINFNIGKFIKTAIDKDIILHGGGHNLAAGFTIKKNKIPELKNYINSVYKKYNSKLKYEYISKISLNAINYEFYKNLQILGPFGNANSSPVFLLEQIQVINPKILDNRFVSFYAKGKSGKLISCISFHILESEINQTLLNNKNKMSLIVQIKENNWNNKKNIQLTVVDTITHLNNT
tara:strand:- start:58 stop:1761 length:1704 start_codon:yes stop_codon:yes gene_type:complete